MYNYKRSVSLGYADAVAKVKDELKKEGSEQVENKLKKVVDATAGK